MGRRERLEKEIAFLKQQLDECFNKRLYSSDPTMAVALEAQEQELDDKIAKKERALNQLSEASSSGNRRALNLAEGLCKVDFDQAKEIIRASVNALDDNEGGTALFLMEQCRDREGRLLLNSLRDALRINTRQLLEYPVEFSPIAPADELAFLKALGGYLMLELKDAPDEKVQSYLLATSEEVVQEMANLLRSGTTVLIPLSNWQKVSLDSQAAFLEWLVDTFWQRLVSAVAKVMEDYSPKVFFVIMVDGSISDDCKTGSYFCEDSQFDGRKIRRLPLTYWAQTDVKRWLDSYSSKLTKTQRDELVEYIFDNQKEDVPIRVRKALESAHAKSYF